MPSGSGWYLARLNDLDEFFTNAAHGDQDLLEVLAIHRAHDEALKGQSQRASHRHGHQHGREHRHQVAPQLVGGRPVAHGAQHGGGHKGAQCNENAVSEIEHVHQAKHQSQARGDDKNDHAHG
jgi:hypothetical protein